MKDKNELCLNAILDHIDKLERYKVDEPHLKNSFFNDTVYTEAIYMQLFQIGENANKLSKDLRNEYKNVEWQEIIATRNIIGHGYGQISKLKIWNTVEHEIDPL